MILTEPEINKISGGSVDYFDRIVFARAIEAALLAKLRGGVEMPEPLFVVDSEMSSIIPAGTKMHTGTALLAYGAAQRLAGQQRESCTWTEQDDKDMPGTYESSCGEMWSFIDGGVKENRVTYCHHCGGKVVPASPREQT